MDRLNVPFELLETKQDGDAGRITGYASIFGNVDEGRDVVLPGAFKETLAQWKREKRGPKMYARHREPIGVWDVFKEDTKGLYMEGNVVLSTSIGHDSYELAKAEVYDEMSIGYQVNPGGANFASRGKGERKIEVRELTSVKLFEASILPFAMNPKARVLTVKEASEEFSTIRELEAFLRDEAGFSHGAAKALASGGWKRLVEARDEPDTTEDWGDVLDSLRRINR